MEISPYRAINVQQEQYKQGKNNSNLQLRFACNQNIPVCLFLFFFNALSISSSMSRALKEQQRLKTVHGVWVSGTTECTAGEKHLCIQLTR